MNNADQLYPLGLGGSMNAAFYGKYLIVIQSGSYPGLNPRHNGRLLVTDPKAPAGKRVCGVLENIGSARQLVIRGDTAYVTAREDGLFIVDLKDLSHPRLICHYDTIEYATGIALVNDLLAVSLRQYGLELIDVGDPAHPRFVSVIRTGEAQSVCIDGAYIYAGVWGSKELVIADISEPERPEIVCRVPLDGRGDGVAVRDGVCYAATGQHARPPRGIENPDPVTYERLGNGLELFDVRDPRHPQRLSGVKFPPYYGLTFDMWSVRLTGQTAIVSNTRNGLYFVDISDARTPQIRRVLHLPPMPDGSQEPITGFDFREDLLVLTGADRDAYALSLDQPLAPQRPMTSPVIGKGKTMGFSLRFTLGSRPYRRILDGYNVRAVTEKDGRLYAACCEKGILVLDKESLRIEAVIPTDGFAVAACPLKGCLYAAEGPAGLRVYRPFGTAYERIASFSPHGRSVLDLQLSGDQRTLAIQCASVGVDLLDVRNPESPRWIGESHSFVGLFYGRHFPSAGFRDRCFLGVNRDGCFAVREENGAVQLEPLPLPPGHFDLGPATGLEISGDHLLLTGHGLYSWLPADPSDRAVPDKRPIENVSCADGKPRMRKNDLVITLRSEGLITFCDASDPSHICAVCQAVTSASPDLACITDEWIYIPAGHQGLLMFANGSV